MKSTGNSPGLAIVVFLLSFTSAIPCAAGVAGLADIDSETTPPPGPFRWLDVADQAYGVPYRDTYDYTQAEAEIHFAEEASALRGVLIASGLKPNFTYQLKLVGESGTAANERIGFTGRWWQEEWDGSQWMGGRNLNDKGSGMSPSPNDLVYLARRDIADSTSPTGLAYRFTGYLVFAYLVTDGSGDANIPFQANSSFHVLWKLSQRTPGPDDGPVLMHTFDPDPALHPAYTIDFPSGTTSIFGEWERLPMGGVQLPIGTYVCDAILTEESFHGSGGAEAGNWAGAMKGHLVFTIADDVTGIREDLPAPLLRLDPPHPNPFRGQTEIVFEITGGSAADPALDVFDVRGRQVAVLGSGRSGPGEYRVTWSGVDASGHRVAPGVYFLRLVGPDRRAVSRSVVLLP